VPPELTRPRPAPRSRRGGVVLHGDPRVAFAEHNDAVAAPHRSDRLYRVLPADLHDVDPMAAAMLTDDMMEAAKVDGAPSSSLHLWVGARVTLLCNVHVSSPLTQHTDFTATATTCAPCVVSCC